MTPEFGGQSKLQALLDMGPKQINKKLLGQNFFKGYLEIFASSLSLTLERKLTYFCSHSKHTELFFFLWSGDFLASPSCWSLGTTSSPQCGGTGRGIAFSMVLKGLVTG